MVAEEREWVDRDGVAAAVVPGAVALSVRRRFEDAEELLGVVAFLSDGVRERCLAVRLVGGPGACMSVGLSFSGEEVIVLDCYWWLGALSTDSHGKGELERRRT